MGEEEGKVKEGRVCEEAGREGQSGREAAEVLRNR